MEISISGDQSARTKSTLHDLINTIIIGFILVTVVLMFFMGVNTDSSAMWLELDGNTSNISFHKQTSSNVTYNTFNWIHPGMTQWHYQYPSNIRHASDTRKVFYQGGWNNHDSTFQLNDEFKARIEYFKSKIKSSELH